MPRFVPFHSPRTRLWWVALITVAAVSACAGKHNDAAPDGGDGSRATIGAAGGEVSVPSGGVTIPAGAIGTDTTIAVEVVEELPPLPSGYVAAGSALSFTPGDVELMMPATIELAYSGAATTVWRLDGPNDTTWEMVEQVTFAGGVATFETDRFGIFITSRRGSGMVVIDAGGVDASGGTGGLDASGGTGGTGGIQDSGTDAAMPDASMSDANSSDDDAGTLDGAVDDAGIVPVTVLSLDFEGAIPANVDVGGGTLTPSQGFATLGTPGNMFGDTFLRGPTGNTITITFNDLPPHGSISIDFLFAAIDSLDGTGSFPAGDFFRVDLDGVTIFRESFANALPSQIQSYVPAPGVELARHQDLGFGGPGGYYTDSAYDFGAEPFFDNIAHTASTAVLTFTLEGAGVQDISDESWAIDNLRVTTNDAPVAPACTSIESDFTTGVDGWTHTGASVFEQRVSGGNPSGLLYVDTSDNAITYVYAGAQFLGDRNALNGGTLRFDGNLLEGGGTAWTSASQDYGWVRFTSPFGTAELDLVPSDIGPPLATWTTFSVPLTPAAWGKTASEWRAILSDVTEVRICMEALYGAEIQALDNVRLECADIGNGDQ